MESVESPVLDSSNPVGRGSAPGRSDRPDLTATVEEIAGVIGAWCPSLSPDGQRIAYVTDRSGLPRLEVAHLTPSGERADEVPRMVSPEHQEVVSVAWSPDGQWLAYLVSPNGLIRAELHVMHPDGSGARALAGTGYLQTVFAGCWTTIPNTYAFSLADGRGGDADVCLVDVVTGVVRTVAGGGFLAVTSVSPDGSRVLARRGSRGRRHLVVVDIVPPMADADTVRPLARRLLAADFPEAGTDLAEDGRFSADGSAVYLRTVAGRDRYALGVVRFDQAGNPGRLHILAGRDDADLESYAVLGTGHLAGNPPAGAVTAADDGRRGEKVLLIWNVDGVSRIEVRELITGTDIGYRVDIGQRVVPGWSVHRDGRSGILELTEPVAPRSLYHVDLVDPELAGPDGKRFTPDPPRRIAGLPIPELPVDRLAVPELLSYPAADGVELHGLLYRPHDVAGPLPTVVLLHGGPESQERPAFSILIQCLTAAGLAVFAPNVRGSTGYGLTFSGMDDVARRASSFPDVPATVEFLLRAGISAPGRIGVHGWSYGGYLALVALTRWPELFAAGSSHAGMSDLPLFFTETEPWMAAASVTEYGDPATDAALLQQLSPLPEMDRVRAPVLLVHGEQDTNVPVGESVRAHQALLAAGARTELLLLPGEGHTIVGRSGRIASTQAIVDWHLKWTS